LILTALWGVYSYFAMPQRKDPDIPAREAVALCPWPGSSAEKVEQLVTRKIEEKMAENSKVERITSTTRGGLAIVNIRLQEGLPDVGKEFDDVKLSSTPFTTSLTEPAQLTLLKTLAIPPR